MEEQDDCMCKDLSLKINICCHLCGLEWIERMKFYQRLAICPLHQHRIMGQESEVGERICYSCSLKQQ